jgi:hypothetical protein
MGSQDYGTHKVKPLYNSSPPKYYLCNYPISYLYPSRLFLTVRPSQLGERVTGRFRYVIRWCCQ